MADFELLKSLYWLHSPSGYENGIQGFIRQWLYNRGIKFNIDNDNQTYYFNNPNKPLIVAHTDQVTSAPLTKIIETNKIIKGDGNIGADDKNGVWIILQLLEEYPDLNFVFSNEEEAGGKIDDLLYDEYESLYHIPYCLVFDRQGKSDIIGAMNDYCTRDFEDEICGIGSAYGFKSKYGFFSDCDSIRYYLNCVNISCGYYLAHSEHEFTVKKDLVNALEFGKCIIDNITKEFKLEYHCSKSYNYHDYDEDDDTCPICGWDGLRDLFEDDPESGQYCMYCQYETSNEWN